MESWGFGSSFDIKSFSQKLNDTARKIKDDVEKTVDEALGIEAKPKKEGEEGEEINYWQSDDADDGEEGGWDIDQELDIGDGASEEKGAEEVEESKEKEKEGPPPVELESSRLEPPSSAKDNSNVATKESPESEAPGQEEEMKKKDSVKREEKSEEKSAPKGDISADVPGEGNLKPLPSPPPIKGEQALEQGVEEEVVKVESTTSIVSEQATEGEVREQENAVSAPEEEGDTEAEKRVNENANNDDGASETEMKRGERMVAEATNVAPEAEVSNSDTAKDKVEGERSREAKSRNENTSAGPSDQWRRQAEAKLLEKSQQIASILQELDEQKSFIEVQKAKIKGLEEEKRKLVKDKSKMSKEIQRRSNSMAKLKKKETEVQEILEEGEKLSKRQHESEQTIKKLRAKVKELEGEQKKAADKGLANVDEVHKQIVSLEKENKDLKASSEMIELQLQSYQKRVQELQELLSETESKGLENVEKLRKDLQESSARLRETEMQYAEIAVNVPEATKPLVEQIDQLQQELASKEHTWSSVENSLSLKVRDLESKIRQYEKAGVTQQQLLKDGADKIKELLQEKDELQDRLAEVEKSFQSVSGQKEVTEESLSPVQVDDKSAELQVKLMEEKWKRESVEIELEKQKDEFEKRVRKEVEKVKHAMKVQQQGDNNIEYNGKVADTVTDFDPISEISTPQKLIQASSTTNISELEVVCNKLAEELVAKTRLLSASQKRLKDLEMDGDYLSLKTKHTMALELVGEKEEEIEHLNNDLSDLKRLYQEHITDVLERLNQQEQPNT